MRLRKLQMHTKILLALAVGTVFGFAANHFEFAELVTAWIRPIGTAFIKLISMVVVPLVFASLVVGTTSLKDLKSLGRIGVRTLTLYVCMTAMAVSIGLLFANIGRPGVGFSEDTKDQLIEGAGKQTTAAAAPSLERPAVKDLLLNIIPTNPVRSLADGEMLQIIFFAVLMGICLTLIPPERSKPVVHFFEGLNEIFVKMNGRLLPTGIFKLLSGKRRIKTVRLAILGVLPEYRRMGIDALLVLEAYEKGKALGYEAGELSVILEDNWPLINLLDKWGIPRYRTYRVYQKMLA